jgi:hypothetical protein
MTYRDCINEPAMKQAYLEAALWFLIQGKDRQRVEEVKTNLINLGCADLFRDKKIVTSKKITKELNTYLVKKYARKLLFSSDPVRVRAAIDIYYQRYHEILEAISKGKGETLARQLLGTTERHLIEPMPGIGEFLVLLKGWFGDEVGKMLPVFLEHLHKKSPQTPVGLDAGKLERRLRSLSRYFGRTPVKVAVVTSSILYEAHIVLTEVFRMLRCEVQEWPVSSRLKKKVQAQFENYRTFYDGCITATDSSEIRLKPHRDLYSLALHRLGINKNDFDKVIGFEDSESGTIAIRASGIGLCVAVPFSETSRHDFRAASHVRPGGVAEAVIAYNLFLPD